MTENSRSRGRLLIWFLALALFVLHQDFWWWNDQTLLLGFMPVGLMYHAGFSVAAGLLWALANRVAWPVEIEAWAAAGESTAGEPGGTP